MLGNEVDGDDFVIMSMKKQKKKAVFIALSTDDGPPRLDFRLSVLSFRVVFGKRRSWTE